MTYHVDDTIAAIASPAGGAVRGIVRLSGSGAIAAVARWFRPAEAIELQLIDRASMVQGEFSVDFTSSPLPVDLYLWPNDRSYTRQPVAELHTIGSPPLLAAVLRQVCTSGARLAEPGEFTLRAFLAGRLDLTQAEAVLGVIDARGQRDLDTALTQLAGGLARPLHGLRDLLLDLLAELEAGLDFVDEDIEFISREDLAARLDVVAESLGAVTAQLSARSDSNERVRIVLTGLPNVGKSSLFNSLASGTRAIVSDHPGTTRDYLTASIEIDGICCELVDTAGLDPIAPSAIDATAQRMTAQQTQAAEVTLLCIDSTRELSDSEAQLLADSAPAVRRLIVTTKCDEPIHATIARLGVQSIATSARDGRGLDELRRQLHHELSAGLGESPGAVQATAARCRESLDLATSSIARALELCNKSGGEELIAAEVRVALAELGKVVGAVYTDDILDRVFSRFCIGK